MDQTANPALRPGEQTSEYRLTKNALWAGLVLIAAGALLAFGSAVMVTDILRADSLQDLARVLIWGGVLLLTGPTLGYQLSRNLLKRLGFQVPAPPAPEPAPARPARKRTVKKK